MSIFILPDTERYRGGTTQMNQYQQAIGRLLHAGWSQDAIARKCGCHPSSISRIKTGVRIQIVYLHPNHDAERGQGRTELYFLS